MLSMPLMKRTLKSNFKLWSVMTGVLSVLMIAVFFAASSFNNKGSMVLQQYYTLFAAILPLIYIAITANKLIAAQVDNGSFAYVMSTPIKRKTVVSTQAVFLLGSILAMYLVLTIVGLLATLAFSGTIEIGAFFLLNLGSLLLNLAISGIAYFASCFFNTSRNSLAVGAGIPVAFLVIRMLADFASFSEDMSFFKYLTLNSLFSVNDIIAFSPNLIWQFLILAAVAAIGYVAGAIFFKRKDLSL